MVGSWHLQRLLVGWVESSRPTSLLVGWVESSRPTSLLILHPRWVSKTRPTLQLATIHYVIPLRTQHAHSDTCISHQRAGFAPRRVDDREPDPAKQLGRSADGAWTGHGLNPGGTLSRADPAAQRSRVGFYARHYVQSRRVLPNFAGRPAELSPVDG